jgi:hypothetical protein
MGSVAALVSTLLTVAGISRAWTKPQAQCAHARPSERGEKRGRLAGTDLTETESSASNLTLGTLVGASDSPQRFY